MSCWQKFTLVKADPENHLKSDLKSCISVIIRVRTDKLQQSLMDECLSWMETGLF